MELNRASYATEELFSKGRLAWSFLDKAIAHEAEGKATMAALALAGACHKELESLGFVSSLAEMRADVRRSWC
jgi:hypothetical protein